MKTIDLGNFGRFTFVEALYSLEYPIVFTCRKENRETYLFYECASEDDLERWIACPLQDDDLYSLMTNQYNLRKVFVLHEHGSLTIAHDLLDDTYKIVQQMSIAADDLPHEKFFIGHEGADVTFANKLLRNSPYIDKPCLAFRVNPYSTQRGIGLKEDIALLSNLAGCIDALGGNSSDYNALHTPGSTVISIFPKDGASFKKGAMPEVVFKRTRDVFAAENVDEMVQLSQDKLTAVKRIKQVFKSIQDVGNGLEIYSKSANGVIETSVVRPNKVDDLCHEFRESTFSEPVSETYHGVLKGYNIKRRNFTFEINGGEIIEGKLGSFFTEEKQYTVPSGATIYVERVDKTSKSTKKTYYTLKDIKLNES